MPAAVQDDTLLVQVQTRSASSTANGGLFKAQGQQQLEGAHEATSPASRPLCVALAVSASEPKSGLARPVVISMHPEVIRLVAYGMFWSVSCDSCGGQEQRRERNETKRGDTRQT